MSDADAISMYSPSKNKTSASPEWTHSEIEEKANPDDIVLTEEEVNATEDDPRIDELEQRVEGMATKLDAILGLLQPKPKARAKRKTKPKKGK